MLTLVPPESTVTMYTKTVECKNSREDPSLVWWDWHVVEHSAGDSEVLAEGVSWRSAEEAHACADAVIQVLRTAQEKREDKS